MDIGVVAEDRTIRLLTQGVMVISFGARDADDLWARATPEQCDEMHDAELVLVVGELPAPGMLTAMDRQPVVCEVAKLIGFKTVTDPHAVKRFGLTDLLMTPLEGRNANGDECVSMPLSEAITYKFRVESDEIG